MNLAVKPKFKWTEKKLILYIALPFKFFMCFNEYFVCTYQFPLLWCLAAMIKFTSWY